MSVLVKDKTTGEWVQVAGGVSYSYAPIGAIYPYGGTSAPSGYLMCDGSAVSRTDYSALFAVIGTSFGAGDGSTTFNVPDLREATTKGVGLSGKSSNHYDSDGVALGEFVEDRIKSHTHSMNHTHTFSGTTGAMNSNASHTHTTNGFESVNISKSGFGYAGYLNGTGTQTTNATNTDHTHNYSGTTSGASTSTTSSAGSITTEVKAVGVNYIIKAKDVNLSVGGQALADRVETLETVNTMTVTKQGNYINGTNFHGKKIGKVATIEINGDTGASIPWGQITTVGVATGCATPLTELKCTADMLSITTGYDLDGNAIVRYIPPYSRAWIGDNGNIQVFLANPGASDTSYTGNLFIGGSYITK